MKQLAIALAVIACARAAAGQTADDYRGGWRTDRGEAHTYQFSIRGTTVRGIYCTYCADATTLAFVDGTFKNTLLLLNKFITAYFILDVLIYCGIVGASHADRFYREARAAGRKIKDKFFQFWGHFPENRPKTGKRSVVKKEQPQGHR